MIGSSQGLKTGKSCQLDSTCDSPTEVRRSRTGPSVFSATSEMRSPEAGLSLRVSDWFRV
jgi:hypothetical protein